MAKDNNADFEKMSKGNQSFLISEFLSFLRHNKKWWLMPIVVILLAMGLLVLLSSSAIAPFIYPLF
jgi:hypothetical protein